MERRKNPISCSIMEAVTRKSCSEKSLSAAKKAEELSPRTLTIFTIFKPLIYDGLSIGSIYYQGFTQAFLMMPVLWKKIEFY